MRSQTIFCFWYFHACGGHSVHVTSSSSHPSPAVCCKSSFMLVVFSAVAHWAGRVLTQRDNTQGRAQLHYETALRECVTNVDYGKNYLFFLSIAMIQYLFQLLTVSMDFDQALKSLSIFLTAGLYCPYFPFVSIASLKVRKIFRWIPAGKVKSYIPM